MIKKSLFLIVCMVLSLASYAAGEPTNLVKAKNAIIQYVKSGEYNRRIAAVYHRATDSLKKRIAEHKAKKEQAKLAVVLDIDETLLSNYQHMQYSNFGGSKEEIEAYIQQGDDPALQPALKYVQFAQQNNVSLFFVTGRAEHFRASTEKNLKKVGVGSWVNLYMRPDSYHASSIVPFKSAMRASIEKMGYKVVASIGDQWSDIRGGHVEHGYKLPNPFYLIP